jgi:glycosyltransferase involved in cell wall biosynthesis
MHRTNATELTGLKLEGDTLDVSVVIPCLDEAATIGVVVAKARASIKRLGLRGEVVVSDNGSVDGSIEIARAAGARVVHALRRGYGAALRHGMTEARGDTLIMGDADDTYDFDEIDPFVQELRSGADLVMGTRLPPGRMLPGANPWLNRWVGTPALTFVLNRLFGTRIRDTNCGMRALTKRCFEKLSLQSDGMEFASEMVIKAGLHGVRMAEVPATLRPDRRDRRPHLRRWRDGWRHLEFMLLHAPDQLLFVPGVVALCVGLTLIVPVAFGPAQVLGRLFDFHYLFYGGTLALAGLQAILGAVIVRDIVGGIVVRPNRFASAISRVFTFGRGLLTGGALVASGLALEGYVLAIWVAEGFGPLHEPRRSVLGMLLVAAGAQVALFSFLHAVLRKHRSSGRNGGSLEMGEVRSGSN